MFTRGYLVVHPEQTNLHGICRDPLADGTFIPDLPIQVNLGFGLKWTSEEVVMRIIIFVYICYSVTCYHLL